MKTIFKTMITIAIMVLITSTSALAGNLVIKGSTTVLPIAQKAVEAYMKANPDVKISLSGGGSSNGIKAIIDGSTDIANASRFIKDKTDRFIAIIMRHVDRLNMIIEDLLSLSRLEQIDKKEELQLEPRNLKSLIESSVNLIQHKSDAKQTDIEIVCDPDTIIAVDSTIFEQALINLLDNAITYSPQKGQIRILGEVDDQELHIHVMDCGPGIAQSHLPRLFERFYRVDKARSRAMGGTGLGLAIVKHIIQAHGGRVSVESELGNGSTFSIHLPNTKVAQT